MEYVVIGVISFVDLRNRRKVKAKKEKSNGKPAWDKLVPLKDNLKHDLPFGRLQSIRVTAQLLQFTGRRDQVC